MVCSPLCMKRLTLVQRFNNLTFSVPLFPLHILLVCYTRYLYPDYLHEVGTRFHSSQSNSEKAVVVDSWGSLGRTYDFFWLAFVEKQCGTAR